jgi:hypothetical protein
LAFLAREFDGKLGGLEKDFFSLWQEAVMLMLYPRAVEKAMQRTFSSLNERQRRLYAATEALKLGHGGIGYCATLFDCHRKTIQRGLTELQTPTSPMPVGQARKKGAAAVPACRSSLAWTKLF